MRLLGSLTDYVKSVFKKDGQDITLRPNAGTYSAADDLQLPPPDGDNADILVGEDATQTVANKKIGDPADKTKALAFDLAGQTTSVESTFDFNATANQTITFQDGNQTVATSADNDLKLDKAGDTMTGDLVMNDNNVTFTTGLVDGRDVSADGAALDSHLDGGASKHDATEIDYERADGSKKNIAAGSDDVELALTDLDDAIGALDATPTNYPAPTDPAIVADHLASIDTELGTKAETSTTLTAGAGLTGGGDLSTNRTVDVVAADGTITVNADSIQVGEIADVNVAAGANIDAAKLGTGVVDNTEFNYLNGVTSGIQTQLDDKISKTDAAEQSMAGDLNLSGNQLVDSFLIDMHLSGPTGQVSANVYNNASKGSQVRFADVTTNLQNLQMGGGDPEQGNFVLIANDSTSANLTIEHLAGPNTNQQFEFANDGNLEIGPESSVFFVYRSTKWRVAGGAGGGGGAELSVITTSGDVNPAVNGTTYNVDTGTAARTITLPDLSATLTDQVIWINDHDDNAATNNITITPASGESIDGLATDETFILDIDGGWAKLSGNAGDTQWSIETPAVLGEDPSATLLASNNVWTGTNEFDGGIAGNLGIGTASPATQLHLVGSGVTGTDIRMERTDGDTWELNNLGSAFAIIEGVTQHLHITNAGNTGIGTSTPNARLEIEDGGTAASAVLKVTADDTGVYGAIIGNDTFSAIDTDGLTLTTTNAGIGQIRQNGTGSQLQFMTDTNVRMTIDNAGRVGIGITPASTNLHVSGSQAFLAQFIQTNTTNNGVFVDHAGNGAAVTAFRVLTGANSSAFRVFADGKVGIGTASPSTTLDVNGSLSKNSGSFKIDHPLPAKTDTHYLVHSFIEGPQADNIYRGTIDLVAGSATVDLDSVSGMSDGTFILLNTNVQCFTSNESSWDAVKGSVSGNTLTITCENTSSTDTVSWMVVGERHDQHMLDTEWTDESGKVIVEPTK